MGDNLYWMITITDRNQSQKFLSFYKTYGIEVVLSTLGKGTAASEILNDFGLEATQKAVLLSVVTGKVWSAVQKGLQTIMLIDIPGTGIAFIIEDMVSKNTNNTESSFNSKIGAAEKQWAKIIDTYLELAEAKEG